MKTTIIKVGFFIVLLVMCIACEDEPIQGEREHCSAGVEAKLPMSLYAVEATSELSSRSIATGAVEEGDDMNNAIVNLWLIEYDSNGRIFGSPKYIEDVANTSTISVILPEDTSKFTLVAIANTCRPDMQYVFNQYPSITELWKASYAFNNENPGYTTLRSGSNTGNTEDIVNNRNLLIMNGSMTLTSETREINIPMHRNVAKVTLDITNKSNSGVKIRKVRLCNLPSKISYYDNGVNGNDICAYESSFIDLEGDMWENDNTMDGDSHMSLTYYMPRNMQGSNDSPMQSTKNTYAPNDATFAEILALSDDEKNIYRYRFYLGNNMKNNYDIEPNHYYPVSIVINDKGDEFADSRVESFKAGIQPSSNSYIINYNNDIEKQLVYTIPIDRINYFWENTTGTKDPECLLYPDTRWVAEIVWQDTNKDIFCFCDKEGNDCSDIHIAEGTGPDDTFSVRPTGLGSGNVIVGIRLADKNGATDGYLWSWHLWITDYNPQYNKALSSNVFEYVVDGGLVCRFDTDDWKNNLPSDAGYVLMDRNYGAKLSRPTPYMGAKHKDITPLFYFFGRKDPMPNANVTTYSYDTTNKNYVSPSVNVKKFYGITTLENAVKHPGWFYSTTSPAEIWLEEKIEYHTWLRPDWDTKYYKSLFDPTPPGWMIPTSTFGPSTNSVFEVRKSGATTIGFYITLDKKKISSYESNTIFIPTTGTERIQANGTIYPGYTDRTNLMLNANSTQKYKYITFEYSATTNILKCGSAEETRCRAMPIRLIRDKAQDNLYPNL